MKMKLFDEPFELVRSGKKVIEVRCNDDKRKKIQIGDIIEFSKINDSSDTLSVLVTDLYVYPTFLSLYESRPLSEFGRADITAEVLAEEIKTIYDSEKEAKFGALGIRFEKL